MQLLFDLEPLEIGNQDADRTALFVSDELFVDGIHEDEYSRDMEKITARAIRVARLASGRYPLTAPAVVSVGKPADRSSLDYS